jgi:hypothetical protein
MDKLAQDRAVTRIDGMILIGRWTEELRRRMRKESMPFIIWGYLVPSALMRLFEW